MPERVDIEVMHNERHRSSGSHENPLDHLYGALREWHELVDGLADTVDKMIGNRSCRAFG